MMRSSCVCGLDSSAIEVLDAIEHNGGMIDGIDVCPKELL